MKIFRVLTLLALTCCFWAGCLFAQGMTVAYQVVIQPGSNLIANQLIYKENKLSQIMPEAPAGTLVYKWDVATQQFLPPSQFSPISGWSIEYIFELGEGFLVYSPATFTNMFIGQMWAGFDPNTGSFTPPIVLGPGIVLRSCVVPIENPEFSDIIGRAPMESEWIKWIDPATQTFYISVFRGGSWSAGFPTLLPGRAAFFGLIPEPTVAGFASLAFLIALIRKKAATKN